MKKRQKMPVVGAVMTSFPHFVDIDESATQMEAMMDQYAIRHLPVQEKSKIIGIVSERDLHHYVKREAPAAEKDKVRARHIMVPQPYVASFRTPLNEVVFEMAKRRRSQPLQHPTHVIAFGYAEHVAHDRFPRWGRKARQEPAFTFGLD